MKTILLGYSDIHGKTEPVVLAGSQVPITDQIRRINSIKAGDYPKGIVRVEFCELVARNIGVDTAHATKVAKAEHKAQAERIADLKKADPVAQKQTARQAARKKVAQAATDRNKLISEKHAANLKLAAARSALDRDVTKENKTAVEAAETELAGITEKLAAAVKKFTTAEAELKAA